MQTLVERLVRAEGLEPPQLSSLEPKSSASTSSATPADGILSGREWANRTPMRSGFQAASCSNLLESIGFMKMDKLIQHHRDRCGGLITWAHRFAAKKCRFRKPQTGCAPRRLDNPARKWSVSMAWQIAFPRWTD